VAENTDKNASAPPAGDSPWELPLFRCSTIDTPNDKKLRSALIELGHAVSKSDLNIASRRHIEAFWQLME
jgi:hypothetical protein